MQVIEATVMRQIIGLTLTDCLILILILIIIIIISNENQKGVFDSNDKSLIW